MDTKYVSSKFNYFFEENSLFLIYNTLSQKLIKVNFDIYKDLKKHSMLDTKKHSNSLNELKHFGVICEESFDEDNYMYHMLNKQIFRNDLNITIIPTTSCNFRCVYCFENHDALFMSKETEDRVIRFLRKNIPKYNCINIDWFGGEPLLKKDSIIRIMTAAKNIGNKFSVPVSSRMTTNGYLLDFQTFTELQKCGVLFYQITIDGMREDHNKLRPHITRNDSFEKIIKNIKEISQNSQCSFFKITLRTNLSASNYWNYKNYLLMMKELLGNDKRFEFDVEIVCDWGGDNVKGIYDELLSMQRSDFIDNIIKIQKEIGLFVDNSNLKFQGSRCQTGYANGFTINYDGSLHKCSLVEFGSNHYNNKNNNSIGELLHSGEVVINEAVNSFYTQLHTPYEKCRNCCWLPVCLMNTCPYSLEEDKRVRCVLKYNSHNFYNRIILSAFNKGDYIEIGDAN